MTVRIGISGWSYPSWRGVFYPAGLRQRDELAYASRQFDSIEINGSFYSLVRPDAVERWASECPPGFVYALKGSRFITHMKRLRDVRTPLANFFASGVLALGAKLGPILWQLPPSMAFEPAALSAFLALLPRTTRAAAALAREHDARVAGRARFEVATSHRIRHALEVRHPSFHHPDFVALLRRHRVALCVADTAGRFPDFEDVTAGFVYVRLHGHEELYVSGYGPKELRRWAARIERWRAAKLDVYVYFDNDAKVRAPFDAAALRSLVDARGG